ncbi:hypothetical protein EJB05_12867, partial [Eragrostis curvula]
MMKKGQEVDNKDGDLTIANDTTYQQRNNHASEMDALIGLQDQDYSSAEDDNDEDYCPVHEMSSRRVKQRHTPKQVQELEAAYQKCTHPNAKTQQALSSKTGLEIRQVKFGSRTVALRFRSSYYCINQMLQTKAHVQENKVLREENDALLADNSSLYQAMLMKSCFKCGAKPTPTELPVDKMHLILENERLNNEYLRASAVLNTLYRKTPTFRHSVSTSMLPVPLRCLQLRGNRYGYDFKTEATKVTGMVRGSTTDIVGILIDSARWSEMFPGIVASVIHGEVILGSLVAPSDGLIQLVSSHTGTFLLLAVNHDQGLANAELWVQSPRVPNRVVHFLRFSKMKTDKKWVVMDVSIDGLLGQDMRDVNLNNSPPVLATPTECRLLPSCCLIEDMNNGYCKVTWIVHAEYNDTTVPMMFKPLFFSGQALGACRWLTSLQRHCEYVNALHVRDTPAYINRLIDKNMLTMSAKGRRSILEMSHRMMASFYSAISGTISQGQNNVREWHDGSSSGSDAMGIEAVVRMVTWQNATNMLGETTCLVLSATATFWLPCIAPKCVFDYLCDVKSRGEWDVLVNSAEVKELVSITTGHQHCDIVSVLHPDVTYGTNGNLLMQEAYNDESSSLVVYSPIDKMSMGAIMNGGDHTSTFLLSSGFAILPDGCSKARHTLVAAPSSSNTLNGNNNAGGSLLTVALQTLIPGSQSGNLNTWAFDVVGHVISHTVKKIQTAVKADIVIPAACKTFK